MRGPAGVRGRYRALRRDVRQAVLAGEVSHRHGIAERALALTFDDGPSEWTEQILDTLREHGAAATFFVIGESVPGRERTLRRALREGHEIGNHTHTHAHLERLRDEAAIRRELADAGNAIEAAVGVRPQLFRPPFLARTARVRRAVRSLGIEWSVLASIFPRDYASDATAASLVDEVLRAQPRPGSIVDFHDGRPPRELPGDSTPPTREATARAVADLVPRLLDEGYRLVTVSDLLAL